MITPRWICHFLALAVLCESEKVRSEELEADSLRCDKSQFLVAPADSADYRKYAPDREIDILNLALEITPDFKLRTIAGKATLTFKPIAKAQSEVSLDAVDLTVQTVTASERILSYQVTDTKVTITFAEPIPADKQCTLTVSYTAEPTKGLYFRTPEMGYKEGDTHLFTQGEAIEARHWYPCFDAPNEKFTSEITCRVPEGITVLSNGKLVSEEKEAQGGLIAVHWKQDKPHTSYLISLLAGYFKKVEDRYRDIPLAFYTPASEIEQASSSFRDTKDAMGFFEEEIGVPYPWVKYFQVCVNDFVAGGMENTSITTLTDSTLFTEKTENIRTSEGLVAHELAHQWFGDLVTCKDWSHIWLNEGFATYYAHLYDGHKNGRDAMLYGLFYDAKGITDRSDDTKPIVYRKFDSPDEQFSYLAYPKGGWVLHMLRSQLGDDLYRRCIKTYLERHQYGSVVTEDLNAVIEELCGRSYDRFFDQWVYHAHHPELDVTYSWDERAKLAKISINQNQKISEDVLLFQFPLTVRFKSQGAKINRQIVVKEKSEDFYFSLPEAPKLVRIDPDLTLLAKIKFSLPEAMIDEQLADEQDLIGRVLAVEQLASKKDRAAVSKLMNTLNHDPFFGVRVDAARALQAVHTDEAFASLSDSLEQRDARVRQQVVNALTGFYRPEARAIELQRAVREPNPDIVARAVRGLGASPGPEVHEVLVRFLNTDSYRNGLADAAISAIRSQADPAFIAPLQKALGEQASRFTPNGFGRALGALAFLARNEDNKDAVRTFLVAFVNDKKRAVQLGAIDALGILGDPKAIPVLETFATARQPSRQRDASEQAISTLRAAKKPSDEWRDLRNDVLDLKKENRDLKKQIDDLKKKMDTVESAPAAKTAKRAAKSEKAEE